VNPVLDTLFLPLTCGLKSAERAAFLNAEYHPALEGFKDEHLFLQQHFRPHADELQSRGFKTVPDLSGVQVPLVFVLLPKNAMEARYFIALGLDALEDGGTIVCAAANDAGGARIKKILQEFGLSDIEGLSKNHAHAAWGAKDNVATDIVRESLKAGGMQTVLDGAFQSMPGLFAWNKADKGSQILAQHLPVELKGRGADFGCGYGWLARNVLENCTGMEHLCCIDADHRAIEACKINLKQFPNVDFSWADLTSPLGAPGALDWIVMNPPFHEGKHTDAAIGRAFITTAANSLKKSGQLWMVGNVNLPYEVALESAFSSCSKKFEGQGFKIFCAMK
jgi:16S rRNA (guanine1207-N2)-methyltransferase